MSMDLLAIILFLVAIILAFVRHVNIGIVALAMGVICVRIFGLTDKNLISGISSGMFCTLVGITLLFAIIKQTGALDLLAKKIVSVQGIVSGFSPLQFTSLVSLSPVSARGNSSTSYHSRIGCHHCNSSRLRSAHARSDW